MVHAVMFCEGSDLRNDLPYPLVKRRRSARISTPVSVDDLIYTEKLLEAFCSGWDDSLNLYKA